jgi:CMP-N-acetylneuraminic acid synthetase
MRFLAIIPARGGSKGIPGKNLKMVAGRSLIAWTIAAARGAGALDRVVVSTDDEAIAAVARAEGVEVVARPPELARDDTPTLPVLRHVVDRLAAEGYRPEAVMTLQPTSPLRTSRHIDEAAALFVSDPGADSLVSCVPVPHIFHPRSVMRLGTDGYLAPFLQGEQPTRRQDKESTLARNGAAIYITRTERLGDYVFGGRLLPYLMDAADSLDIDTPDDLVAADSALRARLAQAGNATEQNATRS